MRFEPNPLLYGANKDFLSSFRLAIRMKATVDYSVLSRSVEKLRGRYPYFEVRRVYLYEFEVFRLKKAREPVNCFDCSLFFSVWIITL